MLPRAFAVLAWLAGLGVVALVAGIVGFLATRGGALLGPRLLFGDAPALDVLLGRQPAFHGLWPALAGTLVLVVGASLIAIPLGVASGIYLAEYGGGAGAAPSASPWTCWRGCRPSSWGSSASG